MRVDYIKGDSPEELRTLIRQIPEHWKVINIYCQGGAHFAWLKDESEKVPEVVVEEAKPNQNKYKNGRNK